MTSLTQLESLLGPLCLFTLLTTATPGPNNLLLALSGNNYGMRKTVRFIVGIRIGITALFALMSLGISAIVLANPNYFISLKLLGSTYLIYLAFKIAFSKSQTVHSGQATLIGVRQGVLLQFVNPKAMMVVLSCITAFTLPGDLYIQSVLQALIVFTIVGTFSNCLWVLFGVAINQLLSTPRAHMIFNRTLAFLTLATVALLFVPVLPSQS